MRGRPLDILFPLHPFILLLIDCGIGNGLLYIASTAAAAAAVIASLNIANIDPVFGIKIPKAYDANPNRALKSQKLLLWSILRDVPLRFFGRLSIFQQTYFNFFGV